MTKDRTTLARFLDAQAADYDTALAEIRSGRKRSHWIWYTFPQIAGLGASVMSATYALRDRGEAVEYLSDPLLRRRLLEITGAAAAQLRSGVRLDTLMGSSIDAAKLVSSMTLFAGVARSLPAAELNEQINTLAAAAEEILAAAESQGYPRCAHTLSRLAL